MSFAFPPVARIAVSSCALAVVLTLPGCSQPTAEERLLKAQQSLSENDPFSAEIELRKLVESNPDDPAAIEARMMLAAIYAKDERLDDALTEAKSALDKVPINTQQGMNLLGQYNMILKARKRHAEGLELIERFEKEHANEPFVLTSLLMARADLQSHAGETTAARATLSKIPEITTDTRVLPVVRRLTVQTYINEENFPAAIERVRQDYDATTISRDRLALSSELASLLFLAGDYDDLRAVLGEVTELTDKAIAGELDRNARVRLASEAFQTYSQVGNIPGARDILEAVIEGSNVVEGANLVRLLAETYLREGRTSDAVTALRNFGRKLAEVPNSPSEDYLKQADMLQNLADARRLPPPDTSPLTLRFLADPPISLSTLPILRQQNGVVPPAAPRPSDSPTTQTEAPLPADEATTPSAS